MLITSLGSSTTQITERSRLGSAHTGQGLEDVYKRQECGGGNIRHIRVAESHDTVELFLGLY